ncbi:MAG: YciI family protein [Candidatus Binataceae bacterium]
MGRRGAPHPRRVAARTAAHVVTDGPFAETREYVGDFFVIACDAKDEALKWADQLSSANAACEVRPMWPRA